MPKPEKIKLSKDALTQFLTGWGVNRADDLAEAIMKHFVVKPGFGEEN